MRPYFALLGGNLSPSSTLHSLSVACSRWCYKRCLRTCNIASPASLTPSRFAGKLAQPVALQALQALCVHPTELPSQVLRTARLCKFIEWYRAAACNRFATVSRATRDAAAAAKLRFIHNAYAARRATLFARRNADRVTSLGDFVVPNFDSIRMYTQLRDLDMHLAPIEMAEVALLPHSLTKLFISLHAVRINWECFRPLCCLQELEIYSFCGSHGKVELNDSFATALPLLRVLHVTARSSNYDGSLNTTAKVVMPHLVELTLYYAKIVHLDLHFMSALKSLNLIGCTVSTVSAACSTMVLTICQMREGMVLVTPNLRSLSIKGGGLHKLDGSMCRHALSILCRDSSNEWACAKPNVEHLRESGWNFSGKFIADMVASVLDLLLLIA